MALIDLNEQIASTPASGGRAKSGPGGRSRRNRSVEALQEFLVNLGYPVRSRGDTLTPDGLWGSTTNESLVRFVEDAKTGQGGAGIYSPEANKVKAKAIDKMVSLNPRETFGNLDRILNILNQEVSKEKKDFGKKPELHRISFVVDGKEITNFPITYLLGKMDVRSPNKVAQSTVYMLEFLKAYGALPPGPTDWTQIHGPLTKVVSAMSAVLEKAGYPNLQSYMAPMEGFIVDMAQKQQGGSAPKRSILELLDGLFPGGSEYHKVRQSTEGTRRLLAYLAGDLKFADTEGNLIVSEGRVRGSLAEILDYVKGLLGSLKGGRVTTPQTQKQNPVSPAAPLSSQPLLSM